MQNLSKIGGPQNTVNKRGWRPCAADPYRVCCSCQVRKKCVRCGENKIEAEFGASAWKARQTDRRVCLACGAKRKGYWKCKTCEERKPRAEFSGWSRTRQYTQDGSQECNACRTHMLVRSIARSALTRLAPSWKKAAQQKHQAILKNVWAAIADLMHGSTAGSSQENSHKETNPSPETRTYHYTCPHCLTKVRSTTRDGKICTRQHCGKQFRVKDGVVCRAFTHVCPTCGVKVSSSIESGRIQVPHKNPQGKTCRTQRWQSAAQDPSSK